MSLIEQIQTAQLKARKEKNQDTLVTLQTILSQVKNEQIHLMKKESLSDEEVLSVLRRFIKQLKDALGDFEKAGREDLIENARREIALVNEYLPQQLNESEIEVFVSDAITETNATSQKDFGRVMGVVVKKVAGRADGALVQAIVKRKLPSI